MRKSTSKFVATIGVLTLLLGACGGGGEEQAAPTATPAGADTDTGTVDGDTDTDGADGDADTDGTDGAIMTELTEWAVEPDTNSTVAGSVTFDVENAGDQPHEFVVVQTDLAPGELPTEEGKVDEEAAEVEVLDRTENLDSGGSASLSVDLEAGDYALICNIPGHYQSGMHTGFTVE